MGIGISGGIEPTKTGGARELKIGTIDYFGPLTPHAKWGDSPISGGFPAEGQHITLKNFYFLFTSFFPIRLHQKFVNRF